MIPVNTNIRNRQTRFSGQCLRTSSSRCTLNICQRQAPSSPHLGSYQLLSSLELTHKLPLYYRPPHYILSPPPQNNRPISPMENPWMSFSYSPSSPSTIDNLENQSWVDSFLSMFNTVAEYVGLTALGSFRGEHRATASSGDQVHQELKASREVAQGSGEKKREDEAKHEPRHSDSPTKNKMAIVIFSRKQFKTFLDSLGLDPSRKYPNEKLSVGSSKVRRPWTKIILSTDHENHKLAAEHSVDSTKLSGGLGISKRSLVETTPSTTQKPVSPTSTAYRKFTEVVSTNHASPGLASNHNLEPTKIPGGKQLASQYTTKSILFKTLKPVHLAPNAREKLTEVVSTSHTLPKLVGKHNLKSTANSGMVKLAPIDSKKSLDLTSSFTTDKAVNPPSTAHGKITEVASTNHASLGSASKHYLEPTKIPAGKQLAPQSTKKISLFKTTKPVHLAPIAHEKLTELAAKHNLEPTKIPAGKQLAPQSTKKISLFKMTKPVHLAPIAHEKLTEVVSTNREIPELASKHNLEPTKIPAGKQLAPQSTTMSSLFETTKPVHLAPFGHEKLTELAAKHNLEPTKIPAGKQLAPQYTTKSSWYKTLKPVHLAPVVHAKVAEEVSTSQAHSKFVANQNMRSSANPGVIKLATNDLEESLDVTSPSAQVKLGDVSTDIPPKSDVKHNLEPTSTSGNRNLAPINSKKTIVSPYTTRKPIKPVKLPHAPRKLTVKHNLKLTPINSQRSIESSSTTQKPENTTVKVKGDRASDEISKQTPSKYHAKHNLELSSVGQLNETPGEKSGRDYLQPYKQKAHQRHLKHSVHQANRQFMHPLHEPQLYDPSYMFDAPVYPGQDVNPLSSSLPAHMPRRPVYVRPYDPLQMYNGLYDQKQNTRHRIYDEYPLLRR
ncbi:hypothetical protein GE061_006638 [Apolygus lucorum]|uniref:Uncharacterized protein n=1 Tax=Apolygus lucorum TaxID=248454 RepID=A0A8S9WYC4_APOLU|nr:hypothetical protein GE061_006638 [Apolygus lucorum]